MEPMSPERRAEIEADHNFFAKNPQVVVVNADRYRRDVGALLAELARVEQAAEDARMVAWAMAAREDAAKLVEANAKCCIAPIFRDFLASNATAIRAMQPRSNAPEALLPGAEKGEKG